MNSTEIISKVNDYVEKLALATGTFGFTDRKDRCKRWITYFEMTGWVYTSIDAMQPAREKDEPPIGETGLKGNNGISVEDKAAIRKLFRDAFAILFTSRINPEEDDDGDEAWPIALTILDILTPVEAFAFYAVVASELSSDFARNIKTLTESEDGGLNLQIIREMAYLPLDEDEIHLNMLLNQDTVLNTFLVNRSGDMFGRITLRRGVLSYMLGASYGLGLASECATLVKYDRETVLDEIIAGEDQITRMLSILSIPTEPGEHIAVFLEGMPGVGKRFITGVCASVSGMGVVSVNMDKLLAHSEKDSMEYMRRIITKCLLEGHFLYFEIGKHTEHNIAGAQRAISMGQDYMELVLIGTEKPLGSDIHIRGNSYTVTVPNPTKSEQKDFWEYFADRLMLEYGDDIELDEIVSTFDMTPGRIWTVLCCARPLAEESEKGKGLAIHKKVLLDEIKRVCMVHFTNYANLMSSPFTWEDLELPKDSKDKLMSAINRVRYKAVVNEKYGFGAKLPYGKGMVIALYGPPGTGKTMAANVVANELGMDIYRIDLSQVGSKYIGETEKNIAAIFETAKNSNGILFFDEADALFSKRTDVSNSNDRHANAETAFLLQQIEAYDGVSILATNVMQNMDYAFRRRITYMINITNPDEEARRNLWKNVFPPDAPLAKSFAPEKYAVIELTGSNIKAAAISAAYRAAARGGEITHNDIIDAIDEEYRKLGHTGSVAGKIF